jgi:hypothetical protein
VRGTIDGLLNEFFEDDANKAMFSEIADAAEGEETPLVTGPEIRLTIEIEGQRYGQLFVLPLGFPDRFVDAELITQLHAGQISATAFTTIVRHFFPDWEPKPYSPDTETPSDEDEAPRAQGTQP